MKKDKRDTKMTSKRKIEANRKNSLRSTGPKTLRGKRRVTMNLPSRDDRLGNLNAVKHGLYIRDESRMSCDICKPSPICSYKKQGQKCQLLPKVRRGLDGLGTSLLRRELIARNLTRILRGEMSEQLDGKINDKVTRVYSLVDRLMIGLEKTYRMY